MYNKVYDRTYKEAYMIRDDIRPSSDVRDHWSETLDEVEGGTAVTVTRRHHEPVTLITRARYIQMLGRLQELEELAEVYELLSDPEICAGVERAEREIARGEGLSFEEAFGESL